MQNSGDTILIFHRRPSELSIVSLELPELPGIVTEPVIILEHTVKERCSAPILLSRGPMPRLEHTINERCSAAPRGRLGQHGALEHTIKERCSATLWLPTI